MFGGGAATPGADLVELPDNPEDEACFQRLRALRKKLADEAGVPPYVVFSDATLRAMIRRNPQTLDEMLEVSGVGQVKLERYGQIFLDEL